MPIESRLYRIYGRVQGVGFRQFTMQMARKLQLTGYVENVSDGSVECLACGILDSLQRLEEYLNRGPAFGRVDHLDCTIVPTIACDDFHIEY